MADLRHAGTETALGEVTLVAEDDALTGLYFRSHWHRPEESAFGGPVEIEADPLLGQAREELEKMQPADMSVEMLERCSVLKKD